MPDSGDEGLSWSCGLLGSRNPKCLENVQPSRTDWQLLIVMPSVNANEMPTLVGVCQAEISWESATKEKQRLCLVGGIVSDFCFQIVIGEQSLLLQWYF